MNERRLHPFTVLRFLRKTLVVYLLPLVHVLFERNWTALYTALRQDALLFLLLCAVSWGILRVSSWSMDDTGVFHLHWRLGIRLDRALRGEMLAALTIDRPLFYRMAGASRLTLYPVGAAQKHTLSPEGSGRRWVFWGPTASPRWPCLCWPCARPGMFRTGTLPFLPRSR